MSFDENFRNYFEESGMVGHCDGKNSDFVISLVPKGTEQSCGLIVDSYGPLLIASQNSTIVYHVVALQDQSIFTSVTHRETIMGGQS